MNTNEPTNENRSEAQDTIRDWVTVEEFCERFPNIPEKTIRWQLTSRQRNGLAQHVQVIGKRLFLSIRGYAQWLNMTCARASEK